MSSVIGGLPSGLNNPTLPENTGDHR